MKPYLRRETAFAYRDQPPFVAMKDLGLDELLEDILTSGPVPVSMARAAWTAKITLDQALRRRLLDRVTVRGVDVLTLGPKGRVAVGLDRSYTPKARGLERDLLHRAVAECARARGGEPMPLDHADYPHSGRLYPVIGGVGPSNNAYVMIKAGPYPPHEVSKERAWTGGEAVRHYASIVVVTRSPREAAELQRRERHNIVTWDIADLRAGTPAVLKNAVW